MRTKNNLCEECLRKMAEIAIKNGLNRDTFIEFMDCLFDYYNASFALKCYDEIVMLLEIERGWYNERC